MARAVVTDLLLRVTMWLELAVVTFVVAWFAWVLLSIAVLLGRKAFGLGC